MKESTLVIFFLLKNRLKFPACYFYLPHLRELCQRPQKDTKEKDNYQIRSPSCSVRAFRQVVWFGLVSLQSLINLWEKAISRKKISFPFPAVKVKNERYRAQCYRWNANKKYTYQNSHWWWQTCTVLMCRIYSCLTCRVTGLLANLFSLYLFATMQAALLNSDVWAKTSLWHMQQLPTQASIIRNVSGVFSYVFQCNLAAWDEDSQPGRFLAVQLQRLFWPSVWEQLTLMILGCTLSVLSPAVQMESAFLALLNQDPNFKGFWLCLVKPEISVS